MNSLISKFSNTCFRFSHSFRGVKADIGVSTGSTIFHRCICSKAIFYPLGKINSLSGCRKDIGYLSKTTNVFLRKFLNTKACLNQKGRWYLTDSQKLRSRSTSYYMIAVGVLAVGLSYAAVPLYRIFCQAYGYGGTTQEIQDTTVVSRMEKVKNRLITIHFNADTSASMVWNFKPQQTEIKVAPGETALAFYTAVNPTDKSIIGISTYNVIPFEAGQYFNKIQCFCFEEQILNPKEKVHMPVFFYIDPEYADDPKMENVDDIVLSYTFFEAREGVKIPIPHFARQ